MLSISLSNLSSAFPSKARESLTSSSSDCFGSRTSVVDVLLDLDSDSKAPKTRRLTIDETVDEYPLELSEVGADSGAGDGATSSGIGTMSYDSSSSKNDLQSFGSSSPDSSFDVQISSEIFTEKAEAFTANLPAFS